VQVAPVPAKPNVLKPEMLSGKVLAHASKFMFAFVGY